MRALAAIVFVVVIALHAAPLAGGAQPARSARIGFLSSTAESGAEGRVEAFRQGLRELGYVEGQNVRIEYG